MNKIFLGLIGLLCFVQFSFGQTELASTERELATMARDILDYPDFEVQKKKNREFTSLLIQTLKKEESYSYPFDSLQTISILDAEDGSFRVFTWQITKKKDPKTYYGETEHFYFGLIQRKYITEDNPPEYIVIPLIELAEIPRTIENIVLDNNNWLGGLYYPPKYGNGVQKKVLKYFDPKGVKVGEKVKRKKQEYYILMGWNGMDETSNIKFIDVMSFDPNDKERVIFGANVFYFDPLVPKFRALFKYSEYAPFSLNYGYIKKGFGKKLAIVYDHMGTPKINAAKLKDIWTMGPDGSYDALYFSSGAFDWIKNVETVSVLSNQDKKNFEQNQERILRSKMAEMKKMAEIVGDEDMVKEIEAMETRKNLDKYALKFIQRKEKLILKKQEEIQKREAQKLKEAGLDMTKKQN
ncbi:MAG: hypothetical protein MRZ79_18605 [Bacteroidia bacterium]|nr:hypothetical protein [Bacteroidia bacterium]